MVLMETLRKKTRFWWIACSRIKTIQVQRSHSEQNDAMDQGAFLPGILELANVAMATSLPLGIFVIVGQTVKDVAGPATIVSVILAFVFAGLFGLSCSELSSKSWRAFQRSSYEYTYRSGCEVAAFLTGWLMIAHHCTSSAVASRAISENIDVLLANRVSNFSIREFGRIDVLDSRVDFVALLLSLVSMLLSAGSASVLQKRTWTISMNCVLLAFFIFACVAAIYHLDFSNWSSTDKFFPRETKGVLSGAATLYVLFTINGTVLRQRDTCCRLNRRTLLASSLSFNIVAALMLISVTSVVSLLLRHPTWNTDCPLVEAYESAGLVWVKYVISIVSIAVLLATMCSQLNRTTDMIFELSNDGLLMKFFRKSTGPDDVSRPSVLAWIVSGIVTSICAMMLNLTTMAQLVSATIVCSNFITICNVVLVRFRPPDVSKKSKKRKLRVPEKTVRNGRERGNIGECQINSFYGTTSIDPSSDHSCVQNGDASYQDVTSQDSDRISPEVALESNDVEDGSQFETCNIDNDDVTENADDVSSSDTDIDDIVDEYRQTTERALTVGGGFDDALLDVRCTTTESYNKSIRLLLIFAIVCFVFATIVCRLPPNFNLNRAIIGVVTFVCLIVGIACAIGLLRLPRNEPGIRLLTYPDPIRVCISLAVLFVACCLVNLFQETATVLILLWIGLGCFIYFSYGIRHSEAARSSVTLPEEEQGLINRFSDWNNYDQVSVEVTPP